MSLSWGEILDLVVKGAGSTEYAESEKYIHVSEAHRRICWLLDLPEYHIPDATVDTVANQDYVEMDPDVGAIDWVQDKTSGYKLRPEPGGMRGRQRYMEAGQVRPPLASQPNFYVRKGTKLYLRDTPDNIRTLLIGFRFHPPDVTSADLSNHPISPNQYDFQLVQWAIGNYFKIHPPRDPDSGQLLLDQGQQMIEIAKQAILNETRNPTAEESLDTQHYVKLQGYDFSLSGR